MSITEKARSFCDHFNAEYEAKHQAFERQFWGTKMNLSGDYSAELLSQTKADMESLLSDAQIYQNAKDLRQQLDETNAEDPDLIKMLDIIIRTCRCYGMPPEAKAIREETSAIESKLEMARNDMTLGYTDPKGIFVKQSSVGLRNLLRTDPDERVRQAAYQSLRSIGPFVLEHGFVEIIKLRNRLAKSLGYVDYYGKFVKPSLFLCFLSFVNPKIKTLMILLHQNLRLQSHECRRI